MHILLFGNKKDLYDKNPKCNSHVPIPTIHKFASDCKIRYECGCGLSDSKLREGIKKIIQGMIMVTLDWYVPNDVILEG